MGDGYLDSALAILVGFLAILAVTLLVWLAVSLMQRRRRKSPAREKGRENDFRNVGFYNPITEEELQAADPNRRQVTVERIDDASREAAATAFCRKCGKQIPPDSDFCQFCGVKVVSLSPDNS